MPSVNLEYLLNRGDRLYIKEGVLVIEPSSGESVPSDWLKKHRRSLIQQIAKLCSKNVFFYDSFDTGRYEVGKGEKIRSEGLTIQFLDKYGENTAFACFNVDLKKARTTENGEKGEPLKGKKFRVTERMEFYKFWLRTGLKVPNGYSSFPDYMGNLRNLVFTGSFRNGKKLSNKSITTFEISYEHILETYLRKVNTHAVPITSIQHPHNIQTSSPYKPWLGERVNKELEPNQSACHSNYGNKLIRNTDKRENIIPLNKTGKSVQEQTTDEWLDDLGDIG